MKLRIFIALLSCIILAAGVTLHVGFTMAQGGLGSAASTPVIATLALGAVVVVRLVMRLRAEGK